MQAAADPLRADIISTLSNVTHLVRLAKMKGLAASLKAWAVRAKESRAWRWFVRCQAMSDRAGVGNDEWLLAIDDDEKTTKARRSSYTSIQTGTD